MNLEPFRSVRETSAIPGVNPSPPSKRYLMEMLRRPAAAALDTPTDLSAEAVDGATAAPPPAGAMTTGTTGSRLPLATGSSNGYKKEASGRLSQHVALIDPKPLKRPRGMGSRQGQRFRGDDRRSDRMHRCRPVAGSARIQPTYERAVPSAGYRDRELLRPEITNGSFL